MIFTTSTALATAYTYATRLRYVKYHALISLAGILVSSAAQTSQPTFSVTIAAAQGPFQAGSPIKIDITIKNVSDHEIRVEREAIQSMGESTHEFDVRDSNGNPVPETRYYRRFKDPLTWHNYRRSILAPGGTAKDEVTLNKLYDLSIPGEYTVQARRHNDFYSGEWVKSNTIKITVK